MAIAEIFKDCIVMTVPVSKVYSGLKQQLEEMLNNLPIKVRPVRKLTKEQNGLIHVLLKQYGDVLGWELKDMKEYLKEQFSVVYDLDNFSTANCDISIANEFISFIIEHALENEVNLYILNKRERKHKNILEIDKMAERYVIACLKNRTCAICGKVHSDYNTIELHHWNSVASIGGYEHDDGLKTPFMSLCTQHHQEFHNTGKESFKHKYHIEGIWLNEQLVYELLDTYPNHFKLFRKRLKEGKYKNLIKLKEE